MGFALLALSGNIRLRPKPVCFYTDFRFWQGVLRGADFIVAEKSKCGASTPYVYLVS
jgi:hypothetical protein